MRITKDAADSIAVKLTEKKQKAIDKIKEEIKTIGFNAYKKTIPKKVLELFETHPNWINSCQRANFTGKGINHDQIYFNSRLPKADEYSTPTIIADDSVCEKLSRLFNQEKTLKKELEKLQLEIKNALISLGTYAKITSEFKEAVPFLPFKEKNELVVNITEIRKQL
jgi:hypothetical protein